MIYVYTKAKMETRGLVESIWACFTEFEYNPIKLMTPKAVPTEGDMLMWHVAGKTKRIGHSGRRRTQSIEVYRFAEDDSLYAVVDLIEDFESEQKRAERLTESLQFLSAAVWCDIPFEDRPAGTPPDEI